MAQFNKKTTGTTTLINRQGGSAYTRTPEYRLVTLLLTNFVTDQFYRSGKNSLEDLAELLNKVDPLFAAKAAVYARNEFGMRSISHALAAGLASRASGTAWGKNFYDKVVRRPDDMLEIAAAYLNADNAGKHLTNAMKKGFATAFDRFDGYQLAKYRNEGKQICLVDIVNLVRPVPTHRNATALQQLVEGTLRNRNTWESKLSAAGTNTQEGKEAAKAEAWSELLITNRLGYFALVRNLRNMLEQAPSCINLVVEQLQDPVRIRKSMVLPFRLLTAYREVQLMKDEAFGRADEQVSRLRAVINRVKGSQERRFLAANKRRVLAALEAAIDLSCANLPNLQNTLVAIDNSGSMASPVAGSDKIRCNELGALFGVALAKRSNADLMEFGTTARFLDYQLSSGTLNFASRFERGNRVGHGTNFQAIFETAGKRPYDRIVILSDMQSGLHRQSGKEWLANYRKQSGVLPFVYAVDLRGYGSAAFPAGGRIFELAGFSEKVFDLMEMAEQNPEVLLDRINAVRL